MNDQRTHNFRYAGPLNSQLVSAGRIPPQAVEMEQAVLGAMMMERDGIERVDGIISADSFYKDSHRAIFTAISELRAAGAPIDILTVRNQLSTTGQVEQAGGVFYLTELTSRVASAANIEYHAKIIRQKAIARQMIQIGDRLITAAFDETTDVISAAPEFGVELFDLLGGIVRSSTDLGSDVNIDAHHRTLQARQKIAQSGELLGVPSGFGELDSYTTGFQGGDLIVVAARPAMGKTAFALSVGSNASAILDQPVGMISIEMPEVQIMDRKTALECDVPMQNIRTGNLTEQDWLLLSSSINRMKRSRILVDDTANVTLPLLGAICRRWVKKDGVRMIIIDYLQLITHSLNQRTREQEVSEISKFCKLLAKELDVPIIILAQLSRAVETRGGDKRPMLSDLRESGSIEQDADTVMFLYRPEYYNIFQDETGGSTAGLCEVIIAKQRNGPIGSVWLDYKPALTKFSNRGEAFVPLKINAQQQLPVGDQDQLEDLF